MSIDAPALLSVEPQLFVADLPRALAYYTEALGFTVAFAYGEPPFYAQVTRDDVALNLRHVDGPAIDRSAEPDLLSAAITTAHAGRLFAEFVDRGAEFRERLARQPWHDEHHGSFITRDPDGNLLLFAGRTD